MEPHKVFVGQRVQLPEWHGTPDQLIEPPMVEEISTEHRAFSTHTLAKVVWSVREPGSERVLRQSRLFRVRDLKPLTEPL